MKTVTRVLSVATGVALALGPAVVQAPTAQAVASTTKSKFISSVVGVAQKTQGKFGIPASVLIAQAIEASDWGTSSVVSKAKNYFDTPCSASMTASQFASLADAQVGKPYVLGAEAAISNPNPSKFDCSELVEWLYGRSGNKITDLAAAQYNATKKVSGSPKVGDLVFLRNNPARSNGIGHVAVLTKKLSNGDWRIIEAKGRAYGVVRTTLSTWKKRSYYAGLRRQSAFALVGSDSVKASAAGTYKTGCITISSTKYSKFSSMTNSFYANAYAITKDSAYKNARANLGNSSKFIDEVAKVVRPKSAAAYAKTLKSLIQTYHLGDYNVVPIPLVLDSGDSGFRVTALQYLLRGAGYSPSPTGKYDSATVSAVKKFQKAKKLEVDGEAGKYTLSALFGTLSPGTSTVRTTALNTLLSALGYPTNGAHYHGSTTLASVKAFQSSVGRSATGTVNSSTWALLFMSLNSSKPAVTGQAKVGQVVAAKTSGWGPSPVRLTYKWYRGSTLISGATASTYTVQPADAGTTLKAVVTGYRSGYTMTTRASSVTAKVASGVFKTAPTPKISGTPKVGKTLTAVAGAWSPAPTKLSYQWLRDGKAIAGAAKSTYAVQSADAGKSITVRVTATKTGYTTLAKTSAATRADYSGKFTTTPTPKLKGTTRVGKSITATPGTWSPKPTSLTYRWYRGTTAISGATKSTYFVQAADVGQKLTVRVTAAKAGYPSVTKSSAATVPAKKGILSAATPKVTGTAKVGKTLKASVGKWSPSGVKLSYRWYRSGKPISGATKSSYKLSKSDKGKRITVVVTGSKTGYTTIAKRSAQTRTITS